MAPKFASSRPTASPLPAAPTRKAAKAARQVTSKPIDVGRQSRTIDTTPTKARRASDTLRAVHAYAREVFGSATKANRWLERPSVRLSGERPIAWLQDHNDPANVYAALDAIAYGTPV
ncbi:MbcA/ParS/Xre antitoxin family protein [Burkholderia multivorans]|uniref:MbcA/ParS/Xre antitoxin family protein n=1 Tax=Burkholderia multivorans TaxID=87883 RepID=UPI00201A07E6|nr:MbcA/ParS/Xre antitoxin family protein [Burkholderia multivorans]MCO1366984.1 MbcA/ParS/Xre antitoxin family protein [Burkholderia multivorans]MCO1376593.1 MbcA/ParS/Xre antitoxin family protein [Burkholderia multivorans]UQP18554.1 MbcA/ParS/Xre antitoxin family protein [Burkholderia multivorans]UQP86523.1 MbcA/ParS/Xre antitoxin family protein [Burkholderia multivorans]